MPTKKLTKRSKSTYPNLEPRLNSRVRQELIDCDYLHKLKPDELEWLNKFNGEYINASFKNDGTDLDNSPEARKASYDRNNARNRDLYGLISSRASSKIVNYDLTIHAVENELSKGSGITSMEDSYVDYMDGLETKLMMKQYSDFMAKYYEDCE